jgi:hypothetical protein
MQALRNARLLARLVLVWFALAIGVAVASPLVQPQSLELVCSGGGAMKLLVKGDDGGAAKPSHTLDCPLCGSFDAPASAGVVAVCLAPAEVQLAPSLAQPGARWAAATPPARGPPASFG